MNIFNDNTFNLQNILLNNDNRNMKYTLKTMQTGAASWLISAEYHEFRTYIWHIRCKRTVKDIFRKKMCT